MRYKERIIKHNLHKPREYHTDTLKLQEVDFDSSVISHHPKSFEYYFTHGLVVNDRRYIVKEFFVKHGKLYAILTEDEDTYYEMYLSFLDENIIEDLKKDISDLKYKDKQFDKRLSDLENSRKQNQTLSISNRTISISNGNSIELPADKDTVYDDTALKERVKNLEDKPEKTNQTLAINDRTISISNGNSIELPADKDTVYDDSTVIERISNLESKKYKVKGNGLFLDDDGTFHLEIAKKPEINYPYRSNGNAFIKLSPDIRTIDNLGNPIYSIDNDGTLQKSAVIESGLMFNYELSYDYKDTVFTSRGTNFILSKCATNANGVGDCSSLLLDKNIMLEISFYSNWKDKDNKVSIKVIPRIIWTFITDDSTEHYTHHITKEELDSEEPIEIELKKNSKVTNSLRLTLKDTRFFMQSVQGTIALKNPEDNKFYNIPRLN